MEFNQNRLRFYLLLSITLAVSSVSWGQSSRRLMKAGNKFYDNENYRAAIPLYEQVLAQDPDNAKALFRAGVSYLAYDKEKSSDYIYKAQRLQPNVSKEVEYWLGRVDHVNYRFDEAIKHYQLYDASVKKTDVSKEEVALLMEQSRNAKTMFTNPKDLFVKNLGPTVNTPYTEHSPVISQDGKTLIYTTRSHTATDKREAADGEYFEDIVESVRLDEDNWDKPRSLSGRLNSKGHDASIQLFDNDTKLLIYRQNENGDFFVAEKTGGDWGVPQKLGSTINTRDYESDAYITPDGKTMYFATTHYSEEGDKDIFVVKKTPKGDWGKARNLGKTINTAFDEDSPYLTPDGKTMYFTSRGHNTMGGYDVFVTRFDTVSRRWTKPENMGYPINTPDDDAYYRLSADGSVAYLSSYRMGGYGEKDIWTIDYKRPVTMRGRLLSQRDSTLVPGLELIFSSQQADKKTVNLRDYTKPDSATYAVELLSGRKYQVAVSKDGNLISTEELEIPLMTTSNTVQVKDFYVPYSTKAGTTVAAAFKKLYFHTNAYQLSPEAIKELDNIVRLLKANPKLNLSINGYADARNTEAYNKILGDNRAKAAYRYLLQHGISDARLITVSYGERQPTAPNDSPENMQLNRRVEFTVIPRTGQNVKNLRLNQGRAAGKTAATGK